MELCGRGCEVRSAVGAARSRPRRDVWEADSHTVRGEVRACVPEGMRATARYPSTRYLLRGSPGQDDGVRGRPWEADRDAGRCKDPPAEHEVREAAASLSRAPCYRRTLGRDDGVRHLGQYAPDALPHDGFVGRFLAAAPG